MDGEVVKQHRELDLLRREELRVQEKVCTPYGVQFH